MIDYVVFQMPKSREYLFPALAVVQAYVDTYEKRMHVTKTDQWELRYKIDMPAAELAQFQQWGVRFSRPQDTDCTMRPTMVVDMTDARTDMFRESGKHVANVYHALAGVASAPMPRLPLVKPAKTPFVWGVIGAVPGAETVADAVGMSQVKRLSGDALAGVGDGELTGVVAVAGWETYLAASKGLAVVELTADDAPRMWLAKWFNRGYRRLAASTATPQALQAAMKSVEVMLQKGGQNNV